MDARQALQVALAADYRINETDEDDDIALEDFYAAEKVLIAEFGREATENLSAWFTGIHSTAEEVMTAGNDPDMYDHLVLVMSGIVRV